MFRSISYTFRIFLIVLLGAVTISCSNQDEAVHVLSGSTMGTTYNVKIVPGNKVFKVSELQVQIQNKLDMIDSLMSTYKPDSELSRFNKEQEGVSFSLSKDTFDVIAFSQNISNLTNGAFDITVGPLVNLWGFGSDSMTFSPPDSGKIEQQLSQIGYESLILGSDDTGITKLKNVQLDVSAVAKGYAVDQIAELLERGGVDHYLVEVGGEVRTKGRNQDNFIWRLGVEKPDMMGRSALAVVEVNDMALATSGDYRNYFVSEGKRYSHTISPATGWPVEHNLASVSILAESCMEADALATALLVMGEEVGYDFAIANNISAYFVYRDGDDYKIRSTESFERHLLN